MVHVCTCGIDLDIIDVSIGIDVTPMSNIHFYLHIYTYLHKMIDTSLSQYMYIYVCIYIHMRVAFCLYPCLWVSVIYYFLIIFMVSVLANTPQATSKSSPSHADLGMTWLSDFYIYVTNLWSCPHWCIYFQGVKHMYIFIYI